MIAVASTAVLRMVDGEVLVPALAADRAPSVICFCFCHLSSSVSKTKDSISFACDSETRIFVARTRCRVVNAALRPLEAVFEIDLPNEVS